MLYSLKTFGGMVPRVDPRLLQDPNAQVSIGAKLRSGALVPFNEPSIAQLLDAPSSPYLTLYQYEHPSEDTFLTFTSDVDIVKGPIANDQLNRSYITGLDFPRVFDSSLVSTSDTTIQPANSKKLAIPVGAAATLSKSGTGSGDTTSRAYVYTYVRTWADSKFDEGQPTLPAETVGGDPYIDVQSGETVLVSAIEDAPNQLQNGVDRILLYRAVTGASSTEYQLVIDFDIDDAKAGSIAGVTWSAVSQTFSYSDTKTDSELSAVLPSTTWASPEDALEGLISLKNGSFVGFIDNVVHFSEPYQPHAWPVEYRVTLDDNIVGLGAFGNTVVVLTDRHPMLLNAQDPALVIPEPTQTTAPCLSKRGIVNYENTVYYPSADGLMAINSGGIKNITQRLFTTDEWELYGPATFESAIQDGRYFAYYTNLLTNSTGFLILDLEEALAAASTDVFGVSCFYVDKRSDTLYFVQQDPAAGWLISQWEGLASTRTLIWKSKIFTSPQGPLNFAGARVRAMFLSEQELAALNAELEAIAESQKGDLDGAANEVALNLLTFNGDIYESFRAQYKVTPSVIVRFYVDQQLVHTQEVVSNKPFRLPAGCVGDWFEVEVESNMPVYQIDFATSMVELR